jgi:hypothetical protein
MPFDVGQRFSLSQLEAGLAIGASESLLAGRLYTKTFSVERSGSPRSSLV